MPTTYPAAYLYPGAWSYPGISLDTFIPPLSVPRFLTAVVGAGVPKTIYASSGRRAYVSCVLTETTFIDISGDTLLMGLGAAPAAGQDPTPPDLASMLPPDLSSQPNAWTRVVELLVGAGGTLNPTPGTYVAWVQDTSTPEINLVPCLNTTVIIV